MKNIVVSSDEDLLFLAKRCDAVYICPILDGRRMGPLVAYAGKDAGGRNYIGDIYFNFRRIEEYPHVVQTFAERVAQKIHEQQYADSFDTICGIPHGGRTFGQALATVMRKRFVYADRKPKPVEPGKKQEYTWDLSQFTFEAGERVAVAEDVFNNFQNTDHTLACISETGARVVALVGALNRSPVHERMYNQLPVITGIRQAFPEYTQDDPAVIEDVKKGNVEFEVKRHWKTLVACMSEYEQ